MGWGTSGFARSSWGSAQPPGVGSACPLPSVAISNLVPAPGTNLGVLDAVAFDVLFSGAPAVAVFVRLGATLDEVAWDGSQLRGYFATPRSSVTRISGGLRFVLCRAGGWPTVVGFDALPLAATS